MASAARPRVLSRWVTHAALAALAAAVLATPLTAHPRAAAHPTPASARAALETPSATRR